MHACQDLTRLRWKVEGNFASCPPPERTGESHGFHAQLKILSHLDELS